MRGHEMPEVYKAAASSLDARRYNPWPFVVSMGDILFAGQIAQFPEACNEHAEECRRGLIVITDKVIDRTA